MSSPAAIVDALVQFRNVVLEGPPGTGKTFAARSVANAWPSQTGRPLSGRAEGAYAIALHPSTSYEDFVQGLRYDEHQNSFVRRDGFILRVVEEALAGPDQDFLILLDEINRANAPKVLGDLLLALEPSKRASFDESASTWSGGLAVTLPYSGRSFKMPDNVYVLATMNTSDQSIAPLDAALRRRFAFIRVDPLGASEILAAAPKPVRHVISSSAEMLQRLNLEVLSPILGPDGQLGHSYLLEVEPPEAPSPSAVVATLAQHMNGSISHVFWTEHWAASGENRNQFDLIATGRNGRSSAALFYPLNGRASPVRTDRRDYFELAYNGERYGGNLIRWRGGDKENGVWRLQLQGATGTGSPFSSITAALDGTASHPSARAFEHRAIAWLRDQNGVFNAIRLPGDTKTLNQLRAIATWHDESTRGRTFGEIDTMNLSQTALPYDEPYMTWRYAILPQLIAVAEARDAQELLASEERHSWLKGRGLVEPPALLEFDAFLADLGLRLEISGSGVGRRLRIVRP
jgi:dynein-related subfamily AAA family protein